MLLRCAGGHFYPAQSISAVVFPVWSFRKFRGRVESKESLKHKEKKRNLACIASFSKVRLHVATQHSVQPATLSSGNSRNTINYSSLFEGSLYYRMHGVGSGSDILRGEAGELLSSVHPVDIMFIKFDFTCKEKIVPSNYVSPTCQFLRGPLTDRVPIILTDPVP